MSKISDKILGFAEKITKRKWTDTDIERYVGEYKKTYLGYSNDESVRKNAGSGGSTTQILKSALENNEIDGALVCKAVVEVGNKVRAKLFIATNYNELLQSQGSKYVLTNYMKEAIPLIKNFEGKVGIVALPCEITALKNKSEKDAELKDKIKFTISLFCGHASDTELIDTVTAKILASQSSPLKKYTFRKGHWRGKLQAELEDGTIIERSAFDFNQYQNLYYHCSRKCFACNDHFGYDADINLGDAWLFELKKLPIKHNALIAKTQTGLSLLDTLKQNNSLTLKEIGIKKILDAQSRSIVLHYNVSSRAKMGEKLGISIVDKVNIKTKWHQDLLAKLILKNWQKSKSDQAHKIFSKSKYSTKLYLYFFKFLESL